MAKAPKLGDLSLILVGFLLGLPAPGLIFSFISTPAPPFLTSASPASAASALVLPAPRARRGYALSAAAHHFCDALASAQPPESPLPQWQIVGGDGWAAAAGFEEPACHWTKMWHPGVPMQPLNVCTHDPAQDGVISTFLHTYHFWGSPDDYNLLLAMGPCTRERPYMLDIGANLGVYTILGASRGCRALAFEPLSQNILRLRASLASMGLQDRAMLFKHAVGKGFQPVKIGFRPFNPGASALGVDGAVTERVEQITIDGLLLGERPPRFPEDESGASSPDIVGRHINFIKIDTEGYDVAVVDGMLRTLIEGRPPHILIEFGPNDAAGTAGCDPARFVELMYAAGYRMYEGAKAHPLRALIDVELPFALSGKGRRVFEAWFLHDDAAREWMNMGLLQRPGVGGGVEFAE